MARAVMPFAQGKWQPGLFDCHRLPLLFSKVEKGVKCPYRRDALLSHRQIGVAAMKVICGFLALVLLPLTSSAQLQNPPSFPPDTKVPPPQQQRHEHGTTLKMHKAASLAGKPPETCPITQPPVKPFVPPSPYSASIDPHYFWYGTEKLWTSLPVDGTWKGLPHYRPKDTSFRQKMLWFRQGYSWHRSDPQLPLKVTGRRLDAPAPPLDAGSSNGYTKSLNWFMTVGMDFPTVGCWSVTGLFGEDELTFVVWVAK